MDNKVYTPQVVPDTPFPQQQIAPDTGISTGSAQTVFTPATTQENVIQQPVIVRDTIGQTLNTKQRKILQEFTFTQSGALQIGTFQPGVSGDIRISPEGILARDLTGNTTVAIDGDTGSGIFTGEIRSGSTVTGSVEVESGGYVLLRDKNELPSIFIGEL